MRRLIPILLAISLSGCAGMRPMISIQNPISDNTLASLEASYGLALTAAVAYRNRPRCTRTRLESLSYLCARRSIVVRLQHADQVAEIALGRAASFIANNPTLDASSLIQAASAAIGAFSELGANR